MQPLSAPRIAANILGVALLFVGAFGLWGVIAYLAEPASNESRGQLLQMPALGSLVACPLLAVVLVLLAYSWREMTVAERVANVIYCLVPVAAFAGIFIPLL